MWKYNKIESLQSMYNDVKSRSSPMALLDPCSFYGHINICILILVICFPRSESSAWNCIEGE